MLREMQIKTMSITSYQLDEKFGIWKMPSVGRAAGHGAPDLLWWDRA